MIKYLSQMRPEKQRELVLLLLIFLVVVFFAMMIPHYLNARLFNRVSTSVAIMAVLATVSYTHLTLPTTPYV